RAEAQAAGERLRAQLDAHTVHVAGGIEAPAVEHGPGVPADACEDVRPELPLRPELRLLDVPAAPLLRAQAHEGDVAVGKQVVGIGSTQEELIVRRRLAARRPCSALTRIDTSTAVPRLRAREPVRAPRSTRACATRWSPWYRSNGLRT